MPEILKIVDTHPLEREYEAWIIRGIEEYLLMLERKYKIHACTPRYEGLTGADEMLTADSKIIGIQFKRAKLSPLIQGQPQIDFSNLYWTLRNQGNNQFTTIQNNDFVVYGLPTFINRNYRFDALHHCLFFKPNPRLNPGDYYYRRLPPANLRHHLNFCASSWRWGCFWERINECTFGKHGTPNEVIYSFFEENKVEKQSEKGEDDVYYFIEIAGFPEYQ